MAPPEGSTSDETAGSGRTTDESDAATEEWFAASALRIALVVLGFVILLFGLGQAIGLDLLGLAVEVLDSEFGRWLVVAIFGLLLIALAVRGFGWRTA